MYAKALVPASANGISVPLLITTAAEGSPLIDQLHARGWGAYASRPVPDAGVELQIMPDRLALVVDGEAILNDNTDSVSPPGWWDAVDAIGGRVVCVAVRAGTVDLHAADAGIRLSELVDTTATAQALVVVVHRS